LYNKDVSKLSNTQLKKEVNKLKNIMFEILKKLNFKINTELGEGWKKITRNRRIINLEIITEYKSEITNNLENIKVDVSFRNKLYRTPQNKKIKHLFYNAFNKPILDTNIEIKCIDLKENIIEKYRALVTRKNIAIRDIYDIYFVFKNNKIKLDKKDKGLIITKIKESIPNYTEKEFINFLYNLHKDVIDLQPINIVLRNEENIDIKKMIDIVVKNIKK